MTFSGIITVNTDEIQMLLPGKPLMKKSTAGKVAYFELFVAKPSQVYIEITQCNCLVNFFVTESYDNLRNGVSELTTVQKFGKKDELLLKTNKLEETNLYIGVKGL